METITLAPEVSINLWGVLLATLAAMVIGSIWYGPLFGEKWMKLVKITKKDIEGDPPTPMIAMTLLAALQAYILSHFIFYAAFFYPDLSGLMTGLITGFWAFVGFVAPVLISNAMFSKGSQELLKINLGNQLVTLLAIGAVIGAVM